MRWIVLILFIFTRQLFGADALLLNSGRGELSLYNYIDLLEDKHGTLTIQDINAGKHVLSWEKNRAASPNKGFTKSAYWIRLFATNPLPEKQSFLLELSYPHHDSLDLYVVDQNGSTIVNKSCGRDYNFAHRDIPYRNCVFALTLAQNNYTIYLRSTTEGSMALPLILWDPTAFGIAKMFESSGIFLYYGVMLVMVVYNLFLFLSTRKINFLYYVLHIGCFTVWAMSYNGVAFQFLWPTSPHWAKLNIIFSISCAIFWELIFFRSFLKTRVNTPIMDKLLSISASIAFLTAACSFFTPYRYCIIVVCLTVIFALPLALIAGFLCLGKGYRPARFFVMAFFMFIFGGMIMAFRLLGLLPVITFTEFALQFGSAAEVILLSLALADQIKFEQRLAQQEIEHLNESLEQKIKEQTNDIVNKNEQLAKANNELQDMDKQKTQFFQNISHELRTPLTLILNTVQKVVKRYPQDRELVIAQNNSKRLYRLVNQLLDFQRLSSNNKDLKLSPINLTSFIKICNDYICTAASTKEIHVKTTCNGHNLGDDLNDDKIIIKGEIDALEKIIFNFLANAMNYSPPGGTIEFGITTHDDRVRIFVKDQGKGIAPNNKAKLFKVFSQVDNSSTRAYEGSGLGLALSKELTTKMGGEIGVESQLEKGSCFWAEFPRCHEIKPILDFLFVDDDTDICSLVGSGFNHEKISIKITSSASHAREIIAEYQIRVILTDQTMPQEDGTSLLALMATEQPQCARLLCTGHTEKAELQRAIDDGKVQQVYYKPLEISQIRHEILELIQNSGSIQEIAPITENFKVKDWLLANSDQYSSDESTEAVQENPGDSSKELILVIDDLPDMRALITGILREQKYRIMVAGNGVDGLEKAKAYKPNLIVVDWMMPKMSGPEFIGALRETNAIATTPVILLTANANQDSKLAGLSVGADAFLGKPFAELELVSTVNNMLRLKSGEQKIASSLEDKKILVAMITHDIANPLTIATTATEMLEMLLSTPPFTEKKDVATYLAMIKKAGVSIHSIISQVKLLESVDTKQIFDFNSVNISEAFDESFYLVKDQIAAKQIVIEKAIDAVTAYCDKSALVHSVIVNILTNAIKFSKMGGKITCSAKFASENHVVIEISDEGSGIPPEIQKVLFSIGHKTSRLGTLGEKGTGFGLPIVKKLITKMDGTITVESPYQLDAHKACSGSKFSVMLPRQKKNTDIINADQNSDNQINLQKLAA